MRILAALVFLLFAGLAAGHAEVMPDPRPYLRIEAGMHTAGINRIGVSADGRLLVTASNDKTARLWSLPDRKLLKTFRVPVGAGNDGKIYAVALSPDGRLLAAAGWDVGYRLQGDALHIYLFDTVSGGLVRRLGPLPNAVNDLAFSPDGRHLAAGLWGANGIRMWTAPFDGAPAADTGYGDGVYGLAFSPPGTRLAVTSLDGFIRLYETSADSRQLALIQLKKAPGGLWSFGIDFSPDGSRLALGYDDTARVDVLDAATLAWLFSADTGFAGNTKFGNLFSADTGFVGNAKFGSIAWSADGARLHAAGTYGDGVTYPVIAWDEAGRGKPQSLGGPLNTIMDLAALPRGGVAYAAADPGFGFFGADGKPGHVQGPVTADMRGKRGGHFWSAADGSAVWFGMNLWSGDPWLFDVARLAFEPAPERPAGFIEPRTGTLRIENWANQLGPTLDGRVLTLQHNELSRSLAIAPDGRSFILGAEWSLNRFDAQGKLMWIAYTPGVAWGVNLSADGQIVVAAMGDGTIRWYRASDGAEFLAFFVHVPDKRWIAWTPSGYYAASPGAEDLIGWHVNGQSWDSPVEFFPASRFRDRFYRPDIVQLVLKTRDEARAVKEANTRAQRRMEDESLIKSAPAVVEIVADPRGIEAKDAQLTLSYRLRTPSGRAVTRVEVKIDGRPIEARGMVEVQPGEPHGNLQLTVPVPPRDSTVSLIAWTGEQASEAASVAIKWTGAARVPPKAKLYAVLVGVSEYEDRNLTLGYADDDARALDSLLNAQAGRGFASVETRLLIDKDASEDAIEEALEWLNENAGPDDTALVFMAGHGFTDGDQKFYFLPVGGNPAKLRSTGISGATLRDVLGTIKGKAIFLIDACRSGSALDGGLGIAFTGFVNELSSAENGVVMFAASTGLQVAVERSEWGHGAFTKALLDGLAGKADYEKDGRISAGELNVWLDAEVRRLTEGGQTPVMVAPRAVTEFALASVE